MTDSKTATGLIATLCLITLLVIAVLVALYVPQPDSRGHAELSGVILSRCDWDNVPLAQAIDEVNAELSKSTQCRARLFLGSGLEAQHMPNVSLKVDSLPAAECAKYIAELNGLSAYSVPEGIILDVMHQDHRSWLRRYCDWVRYTLLQRWLGR